MRDTPQRSMVRKRSPVREVDSPVPAEVDVVGLVRAGPGPADVRDARNQALNCREYSNTRELPFLELRVSIGRGTATKRVHERPRPEDDAGGRSRPPAGGLRGKDTEANRTRQEAA